MSEFKPRFNDLVTLYKDTVSRNASRPLFGTKRNGAWEWITYSQFAADVDRARAGLAQIGIGKGDRVAVISNNRVEWAVGAYATYTIGGSWVPMYEAQQEKEWQFILHDCGAKAVFAANPEIAGKLVAMKAELPELQHVVCIEGACEGALSYKELLEKGAANPIPAVEVAPKDICGYIYTSGTTGNPKGVLLSHSNIANNSSAALEVFPIAAEHRSLSFLPWAHSFGQTAELHTLFAAGASLAICEGIPKIIDNLAEVSPSILMAVPNIFNKIYDGVQKQMASKPAIIQSLFRNGMRAQAEQKAGKTLSLADTLVLALAKKLVFSKIVAKFGGKLQFAISGGAALSREVGEFVDNLGIEVFEGYGLTETSPVAAANTPKGGRRIGTVGKPIPGVRIVIDHEASGNDEEGEIVIYGHNVMQGYYNLPEETAKVFTPDGGFRTGDLGRFDADGFLYITGRLKELYKLENGKYVAPAALESKIQLSPYILQSMVYGANKPYNVAVLVPDMAALKEWASGQGIDTSNVEKLLADERVRGLIREELKNYGKEFKGFEAIRDFHLTAEEFTVANDMLTPKLSMKRRNVLKRFQAEIDAMYAKEPAKKSA